MIMKYKYLLLDADDTLLDFQSAEKNAFYKLLEAKGIEPTSSLYKKYSDINRSVWERFEKGQIKKENIGFIRYYEFIEATGLDGDTSDFNLTYHNLLGLQGEIIDGADKVCARLCSSGYSLNIVTNGFADTQHSRFSLSGLLKYIDKVFISEVLGVQKPEKAFFDKVFEEIGCFDKEKYLIIGDSLNSDILGGINAGIDTCWFNSRKCEKRSDIVPVYTINNLSELINIL